MNEATRKGRINWPNLVTVGSAAILIGTMIVGLGLATGWAIAGMLGLGESGEWVLEVLFMGIAIAGVVAFWRMATRVEPIIER